MTLEQLRIFTAVADLLSMTRAAERLHLTQPAISAAVAALEERYATKLFDRVGRRLELTEAGRLFLPQARAVLAQGDNARRVLEDLAGLLQGEVRIAASQTVATYWLPRRMAAFAEAYPNIQLRLDVGNSARAAARVLDGSADIGVVEGSVSEPLLSTRIVGGDRIGIYAASDHPLANARLRREDLAEAVWVMREPGSGTRDHLNAGLAKSGIAPEGVRTLLELPSNGAVLEAIEGRALIAGVSELAAISRVKAGLIRRLDWPLPPRDFRLLLHRERHIGRAVRAFLDTL